MACYCGTSYNCSWTTNANTCMSIHSQHLSHLNTAAGICGHRSVLLANIPGVHSHWQSVLETRGVCLFYNRFILRPPPFTAAWFGVLVCIPWSANILLMPVSSHPPPSVSPLRAAGGERGGGKHSWLKPLHRCIHPHVREVITIASPRDSQALGEDFPLSISVLPEQHHFGFGGGPVKSKHQLSRDRGGLFSWGQTFNEMGYCAHAWLPLAVSAESVTHTGG